MGNNKILISALFIILLAGGWYTSLNSKQEIATEYRDSVNLGDEKYEMGLYQEAGQLYHQALELKKSRSIQDKLIAAYEGFYKEQESYAARQGLIDVLASARSNFKKESKYWEREIELYMEADEYEDAMRLCKKAESENLSGKKLAKLKNQLTYSYSIDTLYYSEYTNEINGYFTAAIGNRWYWITQDGENSSKIEYEQLGMIGDNNIFLCQDIQKKNYYIDMEDIKRGIVKDMDISDLGLYSQGYCSVKLKDKYAFIDLNGKILKDDLIACGSFQEGYAPVQTKDKKWGFLSTKGKIKAIDIEDIKCDSAGRYLFSDTVIAKKKGYYQFFNANLTKTVKGFKCSDIDIPTQDGVIAFKGAKDLWGFADYKGNIVIEPQYERAKSFSNGLAAVCKNGKWGYINKNNELVVDYMFYECGYVSKGGCTFVSDQVDCYTMLTFRFPKSIY